MAGAVTVRIENCPAVICCGWKLAVTPKGTPETPRAANCVKPFVLASDTSYVVVWPGGSVAVLGVAVSVKLVDAVMVSVPKDTCPLAVTVTGPVAAPVGMTNDTFVALKLEIGAGIAPPPC